MSEADYLAQLHHFSGLRTVTDQNVVHFSTGNCEMIAEADAADPRIGALNAVTAFGAVAKAPKLHDAQAAFEVVTSQFCPSETALVVKAAHESPYPSS